MDHTGQWTWVVKKRVCDRADPLSSMHFGALFGVGAAISLTPAETFDKPITSDDSSDRFSMDREHVLWIFWPSFCAALVPAEAIPMTVINVFLALCGSTLITYTGVCLESVEDQYMRILQMLHLQVVSRLAQPAIMPIT